MKRRGLFLLTVTVATTSTGISTTMMHIADALSVGNHNSRNANHRIPFLVSSLSSSSSSSSSLSRLYSKTNTNPNHPNPNSAAQFSRNEFSRIIHIDRIFQNKRRTLNQQQRDHDVSVKADGTERAMLAERFQLKGLTKLEADLVFRPAISASSAMGGSYTTNFPIVAEGTIEAHLIQTCVRTGESFEVDVEIPVNAIIRPVQSNSDGTATNDNMDSLRHTDYDNHDDSSSSGGKKKKQKKNKKKNKHVMHQNKKVHNLDDIFDLQTAIEQAELYEGSIGGGIDGNDTADVVEDEGIYSFSSDQLDVGELVSQTFYLQLDWYPKKPGSEPVEFEMRDFT